MNSSATGFVYVLYCDTPTPNAGATEPEGNWRREPPLNATNGHCVAIIE